MSQTVSLYPPAPAGVPADLTRSSGRYRLHIVFTLLSLLLFVLLYLVLVAASAWLTWLAIVYPIDRPSTGTVLVKLGAIGGAGMLFLFLLKGLFKSQRIDRDSFVELKEADHPQLFAFIRRLAADAQAPLPRRVYVCPEVNAAVFYDRSLLSLILPVRKNLLIGLGLVNVLPLHEFKAVLAHEFGHFSQGSMRLGSYVYVANHIIGDMVYGRDKWDDILAQWRSLDLRIGVFGWIVWGIVWGLRKLLAGLFRLINFAERAMSRQMEFNADLVAVSVSGSDALIHALSRLDLAAEALELAGNELHAARDHRLYTRDLFYHQTRAIDHLRKLRKAPRLGEPPDQPADATAPVPVFSSADAPPPSMWASHPSNFDREQNARRLYLPGPRDDRSPWLLFGDPEQVREQVTLAYYRQTFPQEKQLALGDPAAVQAFIDEERAETTYHDRYCGLYDGRFLAPGDLDEAAAETAALATAECLAAVDRYFGPELQERVQRHQRHLGEHDLLSGLKEGRLKLAGKDLEFREAKYRLSEVPQLLAQVEKEVEADQAEQAALDRAVFAVHHRLAGLCDPPLADELRERYRVHLAIQGMLKTLFARQQEAGMVVNFLAENRQVEEGDWQEVIRLLRTASCGLSEVLSEADGLVLPGLRNLPAGKKLGHFLLDEDAVEPLRKDTREISGAWIGQFLRQLSEVVDRLRRIHFKSLGGILALQERLERAARPVSDAT